MNIIAWGYTERQRVRHEEIVYGAWLMAALERQKRLPKLEQLLKGGEKKLRRDTRNTEERRKEWRALKQKFGIG